MSQVATWEDLAEAYKKRTGNSAKIRPMDNIFDWAEKQKDLFKLNKDGTLTILKRI